MKHLFIILAILISLMELSCRKGKNDPFLSLRTRNNRITGTWVLKFMEQNSETNGTYVSDFESNYTYNRNASIKIENGLYDSKSILTYDYIDEEPIINDCTRTTAYYGELFLHKDGLCIRKTAFDKDTQTVFTNWYWIDDEKRKSAIAIGNVIYQLDRLASDELIMTRSVFKPAGNPEDEPNYPAFYYTKSTSLEYRAEFEKVSNDKRDPN